MDIEIALQEAIEKNDCRFIHELINNPRLTKFELVHLFEMQIPTRLYVTDPRDQTTKIFMNMTMLCYASSLGKIQIVSVILHFLCRGKNSDPIMKTIALNCPESFKKNTALALSIQHNHIRITEMLLKQEETEVNTKNDYEETPLIIACRMENPQALKMLLEHNHLKAESFYGLMPALHYAAYFNSLGCIKILLNLNNNSYKPPKRRAPIAVSQYWQGDTPLHLACTQKNWQALVQLLMDSRKIDQNQLNIQGHTALQISCRSNSPECVALLTKFAQNSINYASRGIDPKQRSAIELATGNEALMALYLYCPTPKIQEMLNPSEDIVSNAISAFDELRLRILMCMGARIPSNIITNFNVASSEMASNNPGFIPFCEFVNKAYEKPELVICESFVNPNFINLRREIQERCTAAFKAFDDYHFDLNSEMIASQNCMVIVLNVDVITGEKRMFLVHSSQLSLKREDQKQ